MREIVTVTGNITASEVGFCQFHEHLLIKKGKSSEINPALCMEDVNKSVSEVQDFCSSGGRTLIDAQPGGCGRMAEGLAEISQRTGANIICSTGFHKLIFYPENHWIFRTGQDELGEFFIRELTEGVDNACEESFSGETGKQRAGIIKCALDRENLTLRYKTLFRAAAEAAIATGRTMMIHIEKGSNAVQLQRWLIHLGMDPEHMVFCHLDRAESDMEVHREIMNEGSYLEFDTIGRFRYHSDEQEIRKFLYLLEAGYEKQLLFSLDTTGERLRAYCPSGVGLTYILDVFLDKMLRAGITRNQIEAISNRNCIKALT